MKRRTFLKQLGLAASLPCFGINITAGAAESGPAKAPGHLRILTCNIRVDVAEDRKSGDGWEARKDLCASVIRAHEPDLIGYQEVQEIHFKNLKAALPGYATFALSPPVPGFLPSDAIMYLAERFELISAGGFWLSEKPHVAGSKSWDTAH